MRDNSIFKNFELLFHSFQLAQTGRVFIQSDGSLLIRMATVDDSGMYACRIASVGSTPEIERFRLQVEGKNPILRLPFWPSYSVWTGNIFSLFLKLNAS